MLLGLKGVRYRIGATVLLDGVEFSLEERERVALVGRNGAGKSTLFRILSGEWQAEEGQVIRRDGLTVSCLEQAVPHAQDALVYDIVAMGLGELGEAVCTVQRLSAEGQLSAQDQQSLDRAHHALEAAHGWHLSSEVDQALSRMKLDGRVSFGSLSGGMKRKVMLARALVSNPDVLMLDEPTNHLDIPSIELLEEQIRQFRGAVIFVSHDRAFMRKLATRVYDLDRGQLKSWSGGYEGFLKGKAEFLAAEEKNNALFDKKLAEEEVWIRRGIEARRTRNEGRVRALIDMRRQFAERRQVVGTAKVQVQEAERSGKVVAEITDLTVQLGGLTLLRQFSNVILRGEKIAVLGPNGVGKTTALRAILGDLKADQGLVKLGTKLEVAYFDQLRNQFNEQDTAVDIIGAGKEFITLNGQPRHVMGYLQDFLFTPDRARQPVRSLSGGERARLLLAQLFATPSNLMVLDEPTNDLDIETLELLEERLVAYEGTLIVVSHDREFVDRIATRCWVFEGQGQVGDYVGGYEDWLRTRTVDPWLAVGQAAQASAAPAPSAAQAQSVSPAKPKKLGYKEQRELEALPARIEQLETEQAALVAAISDPGFYQQPAAQMNATQQKLAALEAELEQAYARWTELEEKAQP